MPSPPTTVPHAPFLLDQLTAPFLKTDDRGILLAVGGVAYDRAPKLIEDEKTRMDLLAMRRAETERGRESSDYPQHECPVDESDQGIGQQVLGVAALVGDLHVAEHPADVSVGEAAQRTEPA